MSPNEHKAHADVRSDDYYKVLGVERSATEADVTKAYKRLALRHHPDKHPDPEDKARAEETFKRISEAYSVLSDGEKRKMYDLYGKDGPQAGGAASAGPGFGDFTGGQGSSGLSREQAEEIFRALFGGGMGATGGARGGGPGGSPFVFMSSGAGFGGAAPMDVDSDAGPLPMDVGSLFSGILGGGGEFSARRRRSAPQHALPMGTAVVIRGLVGAAEHNGKSGRVLSFDAGRSRYEVNVEDGGTLSVKPQNLTQQCGVEVTGLSAKPELNGKFGDVISYDGEAGRYMVLMQNPPTAVALQPKNCILREGTRVVLTDLANSRYNGQMACIAAVDRGAGRYTVHCQSGEDIKVKYEKVVC